MTYDEASRIYGGIGATRLSALRDNLVQLAIRYAQARTEWSVADLAARRQLDEHRTRIHDAFIDACNILSRNMAAAGEDIEWRRSLGHDRRNIGDFACYLHCILGIHAR